MLKSMYVLNLFIIIFLIDGGVSELQNEAGYSSLRKTLESFSASQNGSRPSLHPHSQRGTKGHSDVKGMQLPCSLGLKDKANTQVVMSSSTPLCQKSEADSGRLDEKPTDTSSGSWCGRSEERNWIDVDFGATQFVAGVVTQGSPSSNRWVKAFAVACGNEHGQYIEYQENGKQKIFEANSGRNGKAFNIFSNVISCRRIRIIPKSWNSKPCMRVEVLHTGCYAPGEYNFYVKSQGADDGWTCKIFVNGVEKSVRTRGFCVVIFNPFTAMFSTQTFDTIHPQNGASETTRMISFLDSAAEQSIVSIAVGDATGVPVDSALIGKIEGLGAVGVSCELSSYGYRDSFAFIGKKMPSSGERPDWVKCQHVRRYHGYAVVHATITTSKHFVEY